MNNPQDISRPNSNGLLKQWPWLSGYNFSIFTDDLLAAIIVTILLVPQSLAYALLAGLPPQVGIYVSIFPLVAYALFGSSRHINVGPTAVLSLMTAATIASVPEGQRLISAAALALITGGVLLIAGLLKAGAIMNFVSRPVVSAYITGAALLIIFSQLKHIFGIKASGSTVFELWQALAANISVAKPAAYLMGNVSILVFWSFRRFLAGGLMRLKVPERLATIIARATPIVFIAIAILVSAGLDLSGNYNLAVVGVVPSGLPPLGFPSMGLGEYKLLCISGVVIAVVAFVDSTSTAQELASRSRGRIDPNKELLALGASNMVAGLSAGYPINGSMSRSAVNFSAGGRTPLVGLAVAFFMGLTALFLTPVLKALPLSVLAALIIVSCFSLIDFKSLFRTWVYSRADGITALATLLSVLFFGVQWGVLVGVVLAMALHIRATLQPYMPLVGRFPGTEHYRDAGRFNVETNEYVKTLRIDESLYYANARYLEDKVARLVADSPEMTDLILMCTAVNRIDASALASLEEINKRLSGVDIKLHFSDMQSRVKERLFRSNFIESLSGKIFLSQHQAMEALEPEPDWDDYSDHIDIH